MTTELVRPPLVSVVTPFYNTAPYLAECIDSVLSQQGVCFEYLLVNNRSTDGSREIASGYAARDPRIRLIDNPVFVGQVENYNGALEHIDPSSSYVKIVQADDQVLPDCLRRMVEVAQRDSHIGLVSSQYRVGNQLRGLDCPFRTPQVSGREVCRDLLLSGRFYLGSPTTVMYRADIVRSRRPFYAVGRLHEDTEAAYEILLDHDLGFVHDVLSCLRVDDASVMGVARRFGGEILDYLINIERFGGTALSAAEFSELRSRQWRLYGDFLGTAVLRRREKAFWEYHRTGLATIGRQLRRRDLARYACQHALHLARQPFRTALKRFAKRALVILDKTASGNRLQAGEWVEVRSKHEILRTLDKDGRLDGLPFMPQMFQFCGTRLRVVKRAHKTCDSVQGSGGRRMRGAVHLEGLRCDGQIYSGCGAACLIFWKEAWLKRVGSLPEHDTQTGSLADVAEQCTEETVVAGTRAAGWTGSDPRYVCQATQLLDATTRMSPWDLRQYLEDYESGNVSLRDLIGGMTSVSLSAVIGRPQYPPVTRAMFTTPFDCVQKDRNGVTVSCRQEAIRQSTSAPGIRQSFKPGDLVIMTSDSAVLVGSDRHNQNRGRGFESEERRSSGGARIVRACVERVLDERTGRPTLIPGGAIILDGLACKGSCGQHLMFCPRAIVPFFPKAWLDMAPRDEPHPKLSK